MNPGQIVVWYGVLGRGLGTFSAREQLCWSSGHADLDPPALSLSSDGLYEYISVRSPIKAAYLLDSHRSWSV